MLYDNEDFSIAYGTWLGQDKCMAMRWNTKEGWSGYPSAFGNPLWFNIDNKLLIPFLEVLKNQNLAKIENIVKVLEEIKKTKF